MRYAVLTAKHHEGFCLRDSRLTGFTAAHAPAGPGDVATPERYQPARPLLSGGVPVPWEACQTRNGSWGYDRDNRNAKSAGLLLRMLIDGVSKNGNMLLNVGPTGRGEFAPAALAVLEESGAWMRLHERSVRGAGPAPFTPPPDVRYTRLYLHLFAWPFGHVHLPGLAGRVAYAQLLHDASEVACHGTGPAATSAQTATGGQPA